MRVLLMSFFAVLLTFGGLSANPSSKGFFPYQYETLTLDNGFTALLIPMKGSGLVAYYTIVRTGSRDEWEAGKSGFAHFFEHMMFRGTEKYSADDYEHMLTDMGANNNAYTTDDYTCYYMVIPGDRIDTALDMESDRFQNLSYEEGPFRTEAGAVYGEFRKNRTNPWSVAYEEISNLAFDKHTYKHTTMGFEADIKDMPNGYEYSKSFFQRYYRPENCILLIAGDFEVAETSKKIESFYGDWKSGYVKPQIVAEPEQTGERSKEVIYEGKTLPLIWIAYKSAAFDADNKMIAAASLLGNLAFGQNSDIYKQLVIREQKVQFIGGSFGFNRDPKFYSIRTMVKNEDDLGYVQEQIDKTIEHFKTEPVSEAELNKLKKRNRYSYLMGLDTPNQVASNLARMIALNGSNGIEAVNQLYAAYDDITPEDIRAAAKHFLQNDRRTIITLKGDR